MSHLFPPSSVLASARSAVIDLGRKGESISTRHLSTTTYMEVLCAEYWLNEARKGSFLPTHSSQKILSQSV